MSWTTVAPSPIAVVTRFTDPWRTSPAAKTPGTLVSSSAGPSSGQPSTSSVQVAPGEDEAALVALDDAVQPLRVRLGADHHEQARRRDPLDRAARPVAHDDRLELLVALAVDQLDAETDR